MMMKKVFISVFLVVMATGISQAKSKQISEQNGCFTVGYNNGLSKGSFTPELPLITTCGKESTLRKISDPVRIIAFLESDRPDCNMVNAKLTELANYFKKYEFVSVVQVTVPMGKCNEIADYCVCTHTCSRLLLLCDQNGIATRAYKYPRPNTVYLINEQNKIVGIGTLDCLGRLRKKAQRMSDEIRRTFDDHFLG